ncbi:hypothetical protein SAMN05444004_11112 [Jannaschia faecimaris]|uniref:Uncharacterized protein n=1 Tax=Jannaschia faecimaris TaxID=1244108 RepID=A0A1H3S7Z5_9RHOB|nr:hypothetical protein SAMN05444004_11112 [Jannaschia faecimaris]
MNNNCGKIDVMGVFGPGAHAIRPRPRPGRDDVPVTLQNYLNILGPTPKRCLEALADLGLSDAQIARYHGIPRTVVTEFRLLWRIDGSV